MSRLEQPHTLRPREELRSPEVVVESTAAPEVELQLPCQEHLPLELALVQRCDQEPSPQYSERLEVLQLRHPWVTARLTATAQSPRTELDVELLRPMEEESSVA